MSEKHPEINYVIQPVAGIANWGHGNRSTAAVHFAPLRLILSKQLHAPVLNPIVPSNFGVFGATKKMSANFARDLEQELDPFPNARVLFVAHSFGGLLCREYITAQTEERDRYIGTITLGTPHLGVEEGRWKGFEKTEKNINAFAHDIRAAHNNNGDDAPLSMVATTLDVMVPIHSALPLSPHGERHLFGHAPESLGTVQQHLNTAVDHNGLVAHPHALLVTSQLARQMIKDQSSRAPLSSVA